LPAAPWPPVIVIMGPEAKILGISAPSALETDAILPSSSRIRTFSESMPVGPQEKRQTTQSARGELHE
jgi:hypothetical protein